MKQIKLIAFALILGVVATACSFNQEEDIAPIELNSKEAVEGSSARLNQILSSTNIALGASASASSTFPGYSPAKVNDGSRNTTVGGAYSWTNGHTYTPNGRLPQWVRLDFGSVKTFNEVKLFTSSGYVLRDYQIQYLDGSTWVPVVRVIDNTSVQRTHTFPAVSSRYIRVYVMRGPNNQSIYGRVNELEVYNTTVNKAIGATATASSTFPGYSPAKINDGSRNTTVGGAYSWANGHTYTPNGRLPQWVRLDFGSLTNFSQVKLYTSAGYALQDYKIQYLDGSTWVTAVNVVGNTAIQRTHTFPAVTSRYVRVYATKGPNNQTIYARVNELEVY